jgi:three-Cys-motif partner protein
VTPSTPSEIFATADELETPEVGEWAEEKGRLLWYYCDLFAKSMKGKWGARVYIDLFANAGKVRVRETGKVLHGSPLLALTVREPFDRYIFCEQNLQYLDALKDRVAKEHPKADVRYVPGDVNSHPDEILGALPSFSAGHKVLSFCFADPYNLHGLKFSTIEKLATRFIDFLILIPAMDPQRAWQHYQEADNHTVDDFVGTASWRAEWATLQPPQSLDIFIAKFFDRRMKEKGFQFGGVQESVLIRSTAKNTPLYRLGFFSKNSLAEKFWQQAKKYTTKQRSLF